MNGNTQFGTATPNGNVNTDAWIDSTASDTLFSAGALKGFAVTPTSTTGLSLNVGGTAGVNDVAIAKNVAGDTARIAGHASTPYVLTLPGAPGTSGQSKVFSIVAFIDTTVTAMTQNGVDTVGVTYVAGTAATTGSQVPPTDAQIRSAIPNGQTAFISVVANVTLAYGATAIVVGNIAANKATMPAQNVGQFNSAFGMNTGVINFNTTVTYTALAQAQITLSQPTKVQISASARYILGSNQESNIRIWDATTNAFVFEEGYASSPSDLVKSSSYTIQATLAAGTHNLQIQVRGFNGSAGTHTVPTNNATISVFSLGA